MQRVGDSTSTANGSKEFVRGQPGTGVAATLITVEWLNSVQRELVNLVQGSGLNIDPDDDSQVLKAVQAIQIAASTWAKLNGKPTTVAGFGIVDAFTKVETSNAIQQAVAALVASSPSALDTLNELAAALGNDPNFATTVTNALANKADKASTLGAYGVGFTTQPEAEGGVENTKPMSALRVWQAIAKAVTQATEASFGWAKIAPQTLVDAGVDDAAFVTPKKLRFGFSASIAANGFVAVPSWLGGWVLQWGTVTVPAFTSLGNFSGTFATTFPKNCFGVGLTSMTTVSILSVLSKNEGGFTGGANTRDSGVSQPIGSAFFIALGN